MRITSRLPVAALVLFTLNCAAIPEAAAYSNQPARLTGSTDRFGGAGAGCVGCHGAGGLTVTLAGPYMLEPNQVGVYTVTASTGSASVARMGVVIASSSPGTPLSIPAGQPLSLQAGGSELVHDASLGTLPTAASGIATYTFNYTMPAGAVAGSLYFLHAASALGFYGNWAHAPSIVVGTRPYAPVAATTSAVTDNSVSLSWSGGGPEYRVVYKLGAVAPVSLADGTVVDARANTSTTISGLAASTQYSFAVFSAAFAGMTYSASAATTTVTTAPPRSASTTQLASSINPSALGQLVTFTATVASASGTPTGTVTFKDDSVIICAQIVMGGTGQARCATTLLSWKTHVITAEYSGDGIFAPSMAYLLHETNNDLGPIPRLANISTRGQVLSGNDRMIAGFVIGGSANKTVVVRARGPSLVPFGIANALFNPHLQLFRSSDGASLATSDNWVSEASAAALAASGFAPADLLEAAILINLPPGAYTAVVSGVGGGTGVGIVEVFEQDHGEIPLVNISTRGQVLSGNDVMIGGFVIEGSASQTVIIRARGPSLVPFGVTNALMDPHLQLFRSSDATVLAVNDDWGSASNAPAITASGFAPSDARESAILISLPPGAYTAIVSGVVGTTGVAIVEVFAR